MSFAGLSAGALDYAPCKYENSQLVFRGPSRRIDDPFVAFLGGNETYGKYIKCPFPALIENRLDINCINFGIQNAGVDVFLSDAPLLTMANRAEVTVLQVVGAQNLSNRFYSVHPRRNDRFVSASPLLTAVYPEVDFAEFHFNKHMLSALHTVSPERFAAVRAELQNAWTARMRHLINAIGGKTVLVWFADHAPGSIGADHPDPSQMPDPLFVTKEMLDALRDDVAEVVEAPASPAALAAGTAGMVFDDTEKTAAAEMLGPEAHGEVASLVARVLKDLI